MVYLEKALDLSGIQGVLNRIREYSAKADIPFADLLQVIKAGLLWQDAAITDAQAEGIIYESENGIAGTLTLAFRALSETFSGKKSESKNVETVSKAPDQN
jgi:hypothetical protein